MALWNGPRALWRVAVGVLAAVAPGTALGCACGCGIFNVGGAGAANTNFSEGDWSAFFRYAYVNQDRNWRGSHQAPSGDNPDSEVNTAWTVAGVSWRASLDWSFQAALPFAFRRFSTHDEGEARGPEGTPYTSRLNDFGDLELVATWTGLQPNLATGILAGVKLPTGNDEGPRGRLGGLEYDRDTLPGTGSTDLILGAYHNGALSEDGRVGYYAQARVQFAGATQGGYRPGNEYNAAAGVSYAWSFRGVVRSVTPVLSAIGTVRSRDSGSAADGPNTGYERVMLAPGVQVQVRNVRVYGDVEVPVYQRVNAAEVPADRSGQLLPRVMFKVQVNYDF